MPQKFPMSLEIYPINSIKFLKGPNIGAWTYTIHVFTTICIHILKMTSDAKVKNSHPHHFNHLISSHSQWHSKECIRSVNKTNDVVLFLFTPIAHHRKQYEYAWDCVRVCVCMPWSMNGTALSSFPFTCVKM